MKISTTRQSRRRFFVAVGAATAATTAAIVVKNGADSASPKAKPENGQGYQLTEHVQNYYRTAKI